MAKKKKTASNRGLRRNGIPFDFSQWNFVIFLTLSFILLVIVAVGLKDMTLDLRSRAGWYGCKRITQLPRPEDCPGGMWTYRRDNKGCVTFICKPQTTPLPSRYHTPPPTQGVVEPLPTNTGNR